MILTEGVKLPPPPYTKAEALIVSFLVQGMSNQQIADATFIHEKTVKGHLTSIYRKAGVKTRVEFVVKYLKGTRSL